MLFFQVGYLQPKLRQIGSNPSWYLNGKHAHYSWEMLLFRRTNCSKCPMLEQTNWYLRDGYYFRLGEVKVSVLLAARRQVRAETGSMHFRSIQKQGSSSEGIIK